MSEMRLEQCKPTLIYEDNQSTISLAQICNFMEECVCEKVSDRTIQLKYCSSNQMLADMLNKGLTGTVFCQLREMAGIVLIPTSFSG